MCARLVERSDLAEDLEMSRANQAQRPMIKQRETSVRGDLRYGTLERLAEAEPFNIAHGQSHERRGERVRQPGRQAAEGDRDGEDGQSENVARHDIHGIAYGERDSGAMRVQIYRYLARTIAEANDQHTPVAKGLAVTIVAAVDDLAAETFAA